jgi:hypothetical protein
MSYIVSLYFVFDIRSFNMQKNKSHVYASAIMVLETTETLFVRIAGRSSCES